MCGGRSLAIILLFIYCCFFLTDNSLWRDYQAWDSPGFDWAQSIALVLLTGALSIPVKIDGKWTSRVLKDEDYPICLSAALMERWERFHAVTQHGIQMSEKKFQEKAQCLADQRVHLGNPLFSSQRGAIMFREAACRPEFFCWWNFKFVLSNGFLYRNDYLPVLEVWANRWILFSHKLVCWALICLLGYHPRSISTVTILKKQESSDSEDWVLLVGALSPLGSFGCPTFRIQPWQNNCRNVLIFIPFLWFLPWGKDW